MDGELCEICVVLVVCGRLECSGRLRGCEEEEEKDKTPEFKIYIKGFITLSPEAAALIPQDVEGACLMFGPVIWLCRGELTDIHRYDSGCEICFVCLGSH